jgi:hypothetical protein
MNQDVTQRHRLVALVLLHATLIVGFAALLGRDLATRDRIVSTDYAAYDTGWSLVVAGDGARLYDPEAQRAAQARLIAPHAFPGGLMAYLNPPHAALAFAPFAWLDLATGFRLWTAAQLVLAFLVARQVLALARPRDALGRWLVVTAVLAFQPLFYAIQQGQLSLLLTLAALRLYAALAARDDRRAAGWLFVLALKPQVLPLLLVLLVVERRWRVLLGAAALGLGAVVGSSVFLGWAIWPSYIAGLPQLEAYFAQGTAEHMVTLRGLLATALGASTAAARSALRLSVAALAVAAAALAFAWTRAEAPAPSLDADARLARRFSLALGLGLALCPHLFLQDVTLWIAALAVFWRSLAADAPRAWAFARFALAWPLAFTAIAAISDGGRGAPLALVPIAAALAWMAWPRAAAA